MNQDIKNLILDSSKKSSTSWAIVRNGVVAEFSIVPGDTVRSTFENNILQIHTERASLFLNFDTIKTVIAESGAHGCSPWTQNIYLCIPKTDAKMSGRNKLTFLGDFKDDYIEGKLWDLGVGNNTLDACIIADKTTNSFLKQKEGQWIVDDAKFLRELVTYTPPRLFKSKLASILVKQKIPLLEDDLEGPHTHLLPPIIKTKKRFAVPIPDSMESVIQVNPFVSVIDGNGDFNNWNGFESDKFQEILQKYGDAVYVSSKNKLLQTILSNLRSDDMQTISEQYDNSQHQDIIRIVIAQIVCDKTIDVTIRKKAYVLLEKLRSINLKGLQQWVDHMAPEISI